MGLVDYSDSEVSGDEAAPAAPQPAPSSKASSKPSLKKVIDRSEPRKIRVDLPSVQAEPGEKEEQEQPPAKRARTAGAFGGFNSLLPAPKKSASAGGPKPGVSLKTSGEAAFSRVHAPSFESEAPAEDVAASGNEVASRVAEAPPREENEPKLVGKATRFMPLSVGKKKKKPVVRKTAEEDVRQAAPGGHVTETTTRGEEAAAEPTPVPPKPKRSLFSVPEPETEPPVPAATSSYECITAAPDNEESAAPPHASYQTTPPPSSAATPNTLQSAASDLNLTAAQRRQLFGRNAKGGDVSVTHFNTDSEYANNEQLRQAGEVVEHRAIKSIAPGKHSLQQLVNNAHSQQDALGDKWAEGRNQRGEGSKRYGWGS